MNKITTISSSLFSQKAAEALLKQPLRRTVNLAEIDIIDDKEILYKGSPLKITREAFTQLMQILKIPTAFIKRFGDMMADKPDTRRQFINTIKNILSSKGTNGRTVTLVLAQETREIVAVHKTERNLISNASFLDVVNQVIDQNNLDVVDFSISNTGNVVVNSLNTGNQFNIQGMKDEYFHAGVSFANDPKNGFVVSPYVNRLVCANGMVSRGFEENYKLTSTEGETMQKFFTDIATLAKKGFKPELFVARVEEAASLKCSLSEMYRVKAAIKGIVKDIKPEDLEIWVPLKYTEAAYARIGIDTKLLRDGQKKNAKTDTSVWDLINGLTHFATHHNGFEISEYDRRRLQVEAGRLLTDEHDMSNFIRSPF